MCDGRPLQARQGFSLQRVFANRWQKSLFRSLHPAAMISRQGEGMCRWPWKIGLALCTGRPECVCTSTFLCHTSLLTGQKHIFVLYFSIIWVMKCSRGDRASAQAPPVKSHFWLLPILHCAMLQPVSMHPTGLHCILSYQHSTALNCVENINNNKKHNMSQNFQFEKMAFLKMWKSTPNLMLSWDTLIKSSTFI